MVKSATSRILEIYFRSNFFFGGGRVSLSTATARECRGSIRDTWQIHSHGLNSRDWPSWVCWCSLLPRSV